MKRVILIILISLLYQTNLIAQENTINKQSTINSYNSTPRQQSVKNTTPYTLEIPTGDNLHFILHFHKPNIDSASYYKAANYFNRYDNYRFLNKRRIIYFDDKNVSIELFSASELKEKYGKRISPYTIKDDDKFPNIEFHFENGNIKEQIIQSK